MRGPAALKRDPQPTRFHSSGLGRAASVLDLGLPALLTCHYTMLGLCNVPASQVRPIPSTSATGQQSPAPSSGSSCVCIVALRPPGRSTCDRPPPKGSPGDTCTPTSSCLPTFLQASIGFSCRRSFECLWLLLHRLTVS